jgi:hypothetical protein
MIFVTDGDMAEAARVLWVVMTDQARAAIFHPAFCGISGLHLRELAAELGPRWEAWCASGRHERREGVRLCEAGAGPKYGLVFVDRLLVTLVHLRTGLTYEDLWGDLRGGLAARNRANRVGGRSSRAIGSRTPSRPPPSATSRVAPLWSGAERPGRMHDQTAVRTEGITEQFRQHPAVKAVVDDGYRGLANEFPGQVSAPPRKPKGLDDDTAR